MERTEAEHSLKWQQIKQLYLSATASAVVFSFSNKTWLAAKKWELNVNTSGSCNTFVNLVPFTD